MAEALTTREERVAQLMAGGFTRKEADELFDFERQGFCATAAIEDDPDVRRALGL